MGFKREEEEKEAVLRVESRRKDWKFGELGSRGKEVCGKGTILEWRFARFGAYTEGRTGAQCTKSQSQS